MIKHTLIFIFIYGNILELEIKSELKLSNMYAYGKLYKLITLHLDTSICLDATIVYLNAPYVWMAPCMFGCPPVCLDVPCMFGHPHMFGHLPVCLDAPYIWMALYVLTPPVCLKTPYVWMHSLYVLMPPYVWMHPQYVWIPPYVSISPCMFGWPHVWTPSCMFGCPMFGYSPVCLDTPMFGCTLNMCGHSHMFGCPHTFGSIQ